MAILLPFDSATWHGSIMGRRVSLPSGRQIPWAEMRGVSIILSLLDVYGKSSDPRKFHEGPFQIEIHDMEIV